MNYKIVFLKLVVTFLFSPGICDAKKYENYTLFRGIPVLDSHLEFLRNLSDLYDMNYWREPGSLRMPVEFVISPHHKKFFLEEATKRGVELTTLIEDVQSAFDMQSVKSYIRRKMETFDWQNYYRIKDINSWLYDLAKAFPKEVQIETIGKSHEDRDILAVSIILKGCLHRSKVIIEGGIHAREWISPAFVTYMIHTIANSALNADKDLRLIAKAYEWHFIPVVNPDGYEYTHTKDRLWRKNRRGMGVDLNRNFGFAFGTEGISFDPYSEIYCGEVAFSENETKFMKRYIMTKSGSLEYYFSIHSYGQDMIIPYAHSSKHVENYDEMKTMGLKAAAKIKTFYGKEFAVGTAYDTVGYNVGGSSTCWVKHTFSVPYVLTFELRDEGCFGFALPANQILPACEETLAGVVSLLKPKTKQFRDIKKQYEESKLGLNQIAIDGQERKFFDKTVIAISTVVFIVVRFD